MLTIKQTQDYVLKKLLLMGADDVVVGSQLDNYTQIKFVNNAIAATKHWSSVGISVFMAEKKRIVGTSISGASKTLIDKSLKRLWTLAHLVPPSEDYYRIARGPFKYKELKKTFDKRIMNLGNKGVDMIESFMNLAIENGASRSSGALYFGDTHSRIITSNNVDARDKGTLINLSDRIFASKDASVHKVCAARTLADFNPKKRIIEGAQIAKLAQNPLAGKSGKFDVIFDPLAFGSIADEVMLSACASAAEGGYSFLKDKLGEEIASNKVTFYDDETFPGGLNSRKFDQEGSPADKTLVIDKGVLKTYLHNTSTAWKYTAETTGNAGLVAPEPTNIILAPGKHTLDGLAAKVKRGLYISNLWYTRFSNYESGEFSTIPRDAIFYIENGKIKHPIKQIRISDNMLRILKNIVAIGKDSQNIIGWEVEVPVRTPHVLIKDVNITRSVQKAMPKTAPD